MADDWMQYTMAETHIKYNVINDTSPEYDKMPVNLWEYKMTPIIKKGNDYSTYITIEFWKQLSGGKADFYGRSKFTVHTLNGLLFDNLHSEDATKCLAEFTYCLIMEMRKFFEVKNPEVKDIFPLLSKEAVLKAARNLPMSIQN